MRKTWLLLFVLWFSIFTPAPGWSLDTECDVRGHWWPIDSLNDCREIRNADKGALDYFWFSNGEPVPLPQAALNCTENAPYRACLPGSPGCSDELYEYDPLAWARQQCRVINNTRKLDLRRCVDKGITFKENSVDNACPTKALHIHNRTDGSPCELLNPREELVDVGNSDLYSCQATGPGPANMGGVGNGLPNGCCALGPPYLTEDHWQIRKTQTMKMTDGVVTRQWYEPYFDRYSPTTTIACNPPGTPAGVTLTHHSCLMTPKDIMIEGFSNPTANPEHQTPGWCDVTTGTGFGDDTLAQFAKDLSTVVGWIGAPKGILVPADPNNYNKQAAEYGCFTQKKNFNDHCSSLGSSKLDHLGFAHSMGAIVTASFDIPFQQFGGSVVGPGIQNSYRNNCDPIPWVSQVGHRAAIAIYATQKIAGGAPGANGKVPRQYKVCSEMVADNVQPTNCINLDGSYIGRPEGPSDCYLPGQTCKFAPWCGENPYRDPRREYTGREDFWPKQCEGSPDKTLAKGIKDCLKFSGLPAVGVLNCVNQAFAAVTVASDMIADHKFDGKGQGDGYRPITGANWGEPRWSDEGTFFRCPTGWVRTPTNQNPYQCCTEGLPDGAACSSDQDCCNGAACNGGRCEESPGCLPLALGAGSGLPGTGLPGTGYAIPECQPVG